MLTPQHPPADDQDRQNRFVQPEISQPNSLRERAASQPPRSNAASASPSLPPGSSAYLSPVSPSVGRGSTAWRFNSATHLKPSQAVPIRSSSFSASTLQGSLSSLRESRAFASTFEDDESEFNEDQYTPIDDERYILPPQHRGRTFAADLTRSRSQSLATATTRPAPIGSPFSSGWLEGGQPASLSSHPLNIAGSAGSASRFGEIKPPGNQRAYVLSPRPRER